MVLLHFIIRKVTWWIGTLPLVLKFPIPHENKGFKWFPPQYSDLHFCFGLKVANLSAGLMSHASSFSCNFWERPSENFSEFVRQRTLRNIREFYKKAEKLPKGNRKDKKFKSVIHPP